MYGWAHTKVAGTTPVIHWLGPRLMHSFARDGIDLRKLDIRENDAVIFSFGEIDCRTHIHRFVTPEKTAEDVMNDLVDRYIARIEEIRKEMPTLDIGIYNIVPPVHKDLVSENPEYPYRGSDEERLSYVTFMNKRLYQECIAHNFFFVNIYVSVADEYGFLRKEISDGHVHIQSGKELQKWIDENFVTPPKDVLI